MKQWYYMSKVRHTHHSLYCVLNQMKPLGGLKGQPDVESIAVDKVQDDLDMSEHFLLRSQMYRCSYLLFLQWLPLYSKKGALGPDFISQELR